METLWNILCLIWVIVGIFIGAMILVTAAIAVGMIWWQWLAAIWEKLVSWSKQ